MGVFGEGLTEGRVGQASAGAVLILDGIAVRSRLGPANYRKAKRALDIVLSLIGLIVLFPVFLLVALVIVATDGAPVLFRHRRVGRQGRPIYVYKFRSMRRNAEQILRSDPELFAKFQANFKLDDDPRITPIGRFLRSTSLDELPQLLNVLMGDMSLVGPRPVVPDELVRYGTYRDVYLSLVPGCTGLWQCSGRSDTSYEERVGYDVQYARNASVRTDLRIIVQTVPAMLARRGAK